MGTADLYHGLFFNMYPRGTRRPSGIGSSSSLVIHQSRIIVNPRLGSLGARGWRYSRRRLAPCFLEQLFEEYEEEKGGRQTNNDRDYPHEKRKVTT